MLRRVGPVTVTVDSRDLRACLTGFKVAYKRWGEPIDEELIPDGWELRLYRGWPSSLLHPTGYWVSIWRKRSGTGEHITIKPRPKGWSVQHNPRNSWTGGPHIGFGLTYDEATSLAFEKAAEITAESADCGRTLVADVGGDSDE